MCGSGTEGFRLAEASGGRTHRRRDCPPPAGFEDRDDHRTACASAVNSSTKRPPTSGPPRKMPGSQSSLRMSVQSVADLVPYVFTPPGPPSTSTVSLPLSYFGWATTRRYGFNVLKPAGYFFFASSSET